MKTYIGTKLIQARPMNRQDYNDYRGWELPEDEDGRDAGYLVEYLDGGQANHPDHAGYISWSPEAVFEGAYQEVGDTSGRAPHEIRVVCEAAELAEKLEKLQAFRGTGAFRGLPRLEQQRLANQAGFMGQYLGILRERIRNF